MKLRLLLVTFLLMILIMTGCQKINGNNDEDKVQPVNSISNELIHTDSSLHPEEHNHTDSLILEEPKQNSNYYDIKKVKIGDSVGGMSVIEFEYNDEELDSGSIYLFICFQEEFEMEGILKANQQTEGNLHLSNEKNISDNMPFSSFEVSIEENKDEKLQIGFYISNEVDLIKEIRNRISNFKKGDVINIRAIFSNYCLFIDGYNFEYWAQFEELIEIN